MLLRQSLRVIRYLDARLMVATSRATYDSLKSVSGHFASFRFVFALPILLTLSPNLLDFARLLLGHRRSWFSTRASGSSALQLWLYYSWFWPNSEKPVFLLSLDPDLPHKQLRIWRGFWYPIVTSSRVVPD